MAAYVLLQDLSMEFRTPISVFKILLYRRNPVTKLCQKIQKFKLIVAGICIETASQGFALYHIFVCILKLCIGELNSPLCWLCTLLNMFFCIFKIPLYQKNDFNFNDTCIMSGIDCQHWGICANSIYSNRGSCMSEL